MDYMLTHAVAGAAGAQEAAWAEAAAVQRYCWYLDMVGEEILKLWPTLTSCAADVALVCSILHGALEAVPDVHRLGPWKSAKQSAIFCLALASDFKSVKRADVHGSVANVVQVLRAVAGAAADCDWELIEDMHLCGMYMVG